MCEQMNIFNAQGYVHLQGFLDKDSCAELTTELKRLVKEGQTRKDEQCPISQAVHGAVAFDSLLEQLVPNFELASGKKLFPTYAYARLYAPGEELKAHTDRPSCEISATLTLGFEGDVWPIYMADRANPNEGKKVKTEDHLTECEWVTNDSEIRMEVGDAVLYRGMEKIHWRNPYKEGKWQAQVFLHYVDANGPYAEWKYDKRSSLAHHTKKDFTYWFFENAVTKEGCANIIKSSESQSDGIEAEIGTIGTIDKTIRDVKRTQLPVTRGIGATLTGIGLAANQNAWKFNITHSNQCDYLKYDVDGHYLPHVDTFMNPEDKECRKLTVLLFLNDDFEGGRLYIQNGHEKMYPPQSAGTVVVFPSFLLHGVEPVTKGIRRSIVTWMAGPWFK